MGAVGVDIHKNEYQYQKISFSDVDCLKGLIKNRCIIDPYYGIEQNYNIYEAGDVLAVNQELIGIYIDLDNLIHETKLNEKQLYIINELMKGYTEEDLSTYYKQDVSRIYTIIDTVCDKLKKTHDYKWKYDYIYLNYLKVEWDYKQCSRCKEYKPKTEEFFRSHPITKDGFQSQCRSCETTKKVRNN